MWAGARSAARSLTGSVGPRRGRDGWVGTQTRVVERWTRRALRRSVLRFSGRGGREKENSAVLRTGGIGGKEGGGTKGKSEARAACSLVLRPCSRPALVPRSGLDPACYDADDVSTSCGRVVL